MTLDRNLLVLDVETTGTDTENSSIIQIAVVALDQNLEFLDSRSCYVKPYTSDWTEKAEQIHHLTQSFLNEKGITIQEALEDIEKFINYKFRDFYIAQWSSSFDIAMLRNAYTHIGAKDKFPYAYRVFDIASFVRLYLASLDLLPRKRVSLKDCAELLRVDVVKESLHDALYDAELTAKVLYKTSCLISDSLNTSRNLGLIK